MPIKVNICLCPRLHLGGLFLLRNFLFTLEEHILIHFEEKEWKKERKEDWGGRYGGG
jgi:hypothetical protein